MVFLDRKGIGPRGLAAALLISTALAGPIGNAALAQDAPMTATQATYGFNFSVSNLEDGIARIGEISGWRIAYTVSLPALDAARAVRGQMSVPKAMDMLLQGTGLSYRLSGGNALILTDNAAAADGAMLLDPVRVEAQADSTALPPAYAGGQVATGGKLGMLGNRDVMDAPVSITSYTAQRVEDQQARTVADVLRNDPSVRALSSSGGMLDSYLVRGFAINTGNAGEVSFNGNFGVAPTYRALGGFAERIEVLKGPSALLNGMAPNSGVGGVINIVPKRAGDKDLTRMSADYGQGEQIGGNVDISRRFGLDGQFGVRFNGGLHDGDTEIDHQTRQTSLGALALDYRGDRFRGSLDVIDQREDLNAPTRELQLATGIAMPSAPEGSSNVTHAWEWSDAVDQSVLLSGEYDLTPDWMLFGSVGGGETSVDRLFGYPKIVNSAGDTTDSVSYMRFGTERVTADLGLRGTFETGSVGHEATLQVGQYRDKLERGAIYDSTVLRSNIYSNVANSAIAVASPTTKPKTSESVLTGVALADTMSFWEDRLLLTLGGRHQRIESDNFSTTTGAVTSSYDDSVVTPMAGIVVKPNERLSVYANYIEGLSKGDIAPNTASNAGEAMAPYVAEQIEAGVKFDMDGLGISAAAFQITKPYGQTVNNVYNADGEQRNRGVELSVFGEVTPDIRLLGGVMLMDAELTETNSAATKGNRPIGVPELQANLTAEWDMPFARGLTLSGTVTHTSSQYIDTANTQSIPDWTTLDLGLRYRTEFDGTPLTLRASLQNVTGEDYWYSVNSWSMVTLGAPRTALFTVTADF